MSAEYDNYLENHKANVAKCFEWLKTNLPEIVPDSAGWDCIYNHDTSKNFTDEYEAYDRYFYGNNRSYAVVQDFNKAWLKHIHRNEHHWQHWLLLNDNPNEGEIILDIPYNNIIEMICDWWSFSWVEATPTEIFTWYDERKDYIKLSENTRKTVEDILEKIKNKLEETQY